MRNQYLIALILVLLLPAQSWSQKPLPPAKDAKGAGAATAPQWKDFVSKAGGFSISMPGSPLDERDDSGLRFRLNQGPRVYGVACLTKFKRAETVGGTLSDKAQEFLDSAQGRLLDRGTVIVSDLPGVRIKFETPDPPGITEARFFITPTKKMYVLIAFTREGNSGDEAERFFNSFKLLNQQ